MHRCTGCMEEEEVILEEQNEVQEDMEKERGKAGDGVMKYDMMK